MAEDVGKLPLEEESPFDEEKSPTEEDDPAATMEEDQHQSAAVANAETRHAWPTESEEKQDEQHQNMEAVSPANTMAIETQFQPHQNKVFSFFKSKSTPQVTVIDTHTPKERHKNKLARHKPRKQ